MRSSFLVDKITRLAVGIIATAMGVSSALADRPLSGAVLKGQIQAFLAAKGLEADPAIDEERQFLPCRSKLDITPMFGDFKTVRIACPDDGGFSLAVRTQIRRADPAVSPEPKNDPSPESQPMVVKLGRSLGRGAVITAGDLVLAPMPDARFTGYFVAIDDVVGRKVDQNMSIHQVVQNRHLAPNWMVVKDQSVIIESKIGPVTVVSRGIALGDGQYGELLKVRNQSSKLVVEGRIISEKKIEIITK